MSLVLPQVNDIKGDLSELTAEERAKTGKVGEMADTAEDEGTPIFQTVEQHRHTAIRQGRSEEDWEIIQRRLYNLPADQLQPLYDVPRTKRGFGTHEE